MDEIRLQTLQTRFLAAQHAFEQSRQECAYLQLVVRAKQEVIEQLLPYYPHPISREMQAKIFLA